MTVVAHDKLLHVRADGSVQHDCNRTLCIENISAGYDSPSILDVKIGFETTYAWANQAYNEKNRCALCVLIAFACVGVEL